MRHVVLEELKTKSGKKLFRKFNEHSKTLWAKQEEIAKKYNSLSAQYDELEHLKNNMNDYLGRDKIEKEKESIIKTLNREKVSSKDTTKETARNKRKNPKKLIYKADSYLILFSNAIAYDIIYDI